ncbi:MAG: hypothetical protein FJ399_18555 [Verrucomicrobia bacterium]|nr:hypothetical protein [Verrucomicrobiota bacterium]
MATPPELVWLHDGTRFRATLWPDVSFETETAPGRWEAAEPDEEALASAALGVGATQWRRYLEYAPVPVREFIGRFQLNRMAALAVAIKCPGLAGELAAAPALTAFLAAHRDLRGGGGPAWEEIEAVHERDGVFGVLQWLGLPASRQTLAVLRNIVDPDLPRQLLEPLRAALWEPAAVWALEHAPALTDEKLAAACQPLAA